VVWYASYTTFQCLVSRIFVGHLVSFISRMTKCYENNIPTKIKIPYVFHGKVQHLDTLCR